MLDTPYQFVSICLKRENIKVETFLRFLNNKFKTSFKVLKDLNESEIQNVVDSFDKFVEMMHTQPLNTFHK